MAGPSECPKKVSKTRYERTTAFSNMSGELFELKMSALLFLRSINSRTEFHIATNMLAAGSFDDVVLTIGGKAYFLQAKHKEKGNEGKVGKSQLFQPKGNFSLLKYYKSYIDLKHQWSKDKDLKFCGEFEKSVFVIYTNATLAEGIGSDYGKMAELDLVTTGGKCTTLLHDRDIHQVLEILSKYKELLSEGISCEHLKNTSANLEVIQKQHNNVTTIVERRDLIQLHKELVQIGDVSHFRQFLSQLCICSEQTGDKGLDSLIKLELKNLCGSDIMFDKFMSDLQHWWRNRSSSVYLTTEIGFWKDIMDSYTASITQGKVVSLSRLRVKYLDTACRKMRAQLESKEGMFVLISSCRELTCVKVLQSLQTDFVVDYNTLQKHAKEVLAVWKLGTSKDVLVVDGWEDHDFVREGICDILTMFPNKKLVVITRNNISCEGLEIVHLKDDFHWNSLDEESQEIIKNIPVRLQGYNETVGSVASTDFLSNFLTGTMLMELITAEQGIEIGHELDSPDACYISRRIYRRMLLSREIFHERQVILAVSGISLLELKHLVPAGEFVEEFIMGKACHQDCRYFIISTDEHYQALCENFDQVHWIHMTSPECNLWKASKQNIKLIKSYQMEDDYFINTETILSNLDQVFLIVSEPGMGKSTELLHFTKMFKTSDPTTWVVRVNLSEQINYFNQKNTDIIELLLSVDNFDTELQRCLFDYVLHTGNVVLMFDGFDEISPVYSEKVIGILKDLKKTIVKHVLITSRPVMKEKLEEELCTLSYSLGNFTVEDQEEFLLKFWKIPNDRQLDMNIFIYGLLTMTSSFLSELTGNPLHIRMLAEIFIDDAVHYLTDGNKILQEDMDLLQLYNNFIEKKWDIFYKKFKIDQQLMQLTHDMSDLKRSFLQNHMVAALSALFSTQQIQSFSNGEDIIQENVEFLDKLKRGIEKKGIIVNEKNGNAVFVHRTFAEYFVALWFTKNAKEYTASLYTDPNLQGVRNFFDRMFSVGCSLHFAVLNRNSSLVQELLLQQGIDVNKKDKGGRTALHLAVATFIDVQEETPYHLQSTWEYVYKDSFMTNFSYSSLYSIVENLLNHNADPNIADLLLKWRPLRLADETKAWCTMGYLLKHGAPSSDIVAMHHYIKGVTDLERVLIMVFKKNFVELLECMLKCGMVLNHIVREGEHFFATLLHLAVGIRNVKMAELLLQYGADLEAKCYLGGTPLLFSTMINASNMVRYLFKKGADLTTCDNSGTTVLHYVTRTEGYDMVIDFLDKGLNVNCRNKKHCTPLMFAASAGRLEIMKLLHYREADLHAKNEDEHTALDFAIRGGDHDAVEWLLKKGCNLSEWSLHIASCTGRLSLVQKLVELGCELDGCSNKGYTPLHVAAMSGRQEVTQWLLQVGANAKALDAEGNTLLHFAAFGENDALVEWLVTQTDIDVDTHNKNGYTPLHIAIIKGHSQVTMRLINAGASLAPDLAGNTVLHLAAHVDKFHYQGKRQIMERLVRCGMSLTSVNAKGWTPLHIAAYNGLFYEVQWIVEKQNVDLEIRTESGYTPYQLAALAGHVKVAKWLEKQKVDLEIRTESGYTPYQHSALAEYVEVVKWLEKQKVDLEIRTESDCTPYKLAALAGHVKVVKWLEKQKASSDLTPICVEDCAKAHLSCGISPVGISLNGIIPTHRNISGYFDFDSPWLHLLPLHFIYTYILMNRGESVMTEEVHWYRPSR